MISILARISPPSLEISFNIDLLFSTKAFSLSPLACGIVEYGVLTFHLLPLTDEGFHSPAIIFPSVKKTIVSP